MSSVALYHCNSIKEIRSTVEKIIETLGKEKIHSLFKNKRVLLKPNACIDYPPERGATTHPAVLDAVISIALDSGADVIVGDGPIVGVKGNVFEKTGISDVCKKYNIKIFDFNHEKGRLVTNENSLILSEAMIANVYFEADTFVNMPVFKSNIGFWLSSTLKNMKGLLVGKEKHRAHHIGVPESVADLNAMVRQDLIIMDGYIGMMGDGPTAGSPANAKLLMGSFDPVAVDTVAAELMGLPTNRIPMITLSEKVGAGSTQYNLKGDQIDSFQLNFEKPTVAKVRPLGPLLDLVSSFIVSRASLKSKMTINKKKCVLCKRCVEACPFDAITYEKKTINVDKESCNFCFCCMEACGENAIKLKGLLNYTDAFMKSM